LLAYFFQKLNRCSCFTCRCSRW